MKKRNIILCIIIFIIISAIVYLISLLISDNNTNWFDNGYLIAHAFGSYNDRTYTNSLEAFNENYQKGHRIFEVDFQFTSDNILITLHDREDAIGTFEEEQQKVDYTLLSFEEVCNLMLKYPDIIIVTDTKENSDDEKQLAIFDYISKVIESKNRKLYNRIIIQVYNQHMYYLLKENYKFPSYIYTLYASSDTDEEVIEFVKKEKIKVVTCWYYRAQKDFVQKLQDLGVYVFAHTVNDIEQAKSLMENGVYGIYTDSITYDIL